MTKTLPNLSKPDTTLTEYLIILPLTAMIFGLMCVVVVPALAINFIWKKIDGISIYSHKEPTDDR